MLQHMTSQTKPHKVWSVLHVQLGVDGLLLHDVHDGGAGLRAALRRGVDGDGLLCRTCVLLPVDVDPARRHSRSVSVSSASHSLPIHRPISATLLTAQYVLYENEVKGHS